MERSKIIQSLSHSFSMGGPHESIIRKTTLSTLKKSEKLLGEYIGGNASARWELGRAIEQSLQSLIEHRPRQAIEGATGSEYGVEKATMQCQGQPLHMIVEHVRHYGIDVCRTWYVSPSWEECTGTKPTLCRVPRPDGNYVNEYTISSLVATSGLRPGEEELGQVTQSLIDEFALSCAVVVQSVYDAWRSKTGTSSNIASGSLALDRSGTILEYLERRRRNLIPSCSGRQVCHLPNGLWTLPEEAWSGTRSVYVPALAKDGHAFRLVVRPALISTQESLQGDGSSS